MKTNNLLLEYIDGRDWRVARTFAWTSPAGLKLSVPKGFVTDFASVPRFLWRILPPTGSYGKAAVVHDYIYRTVTVPLSRAEADLVFLRIMRELGVGWWTRTAMYSAVRLFGSGPYQEREV